MTSTSRRPLRIDSAVAANLLGLLLLVLAVTGVCTAAWFTDWRLGVAITSTPLGAIGWWLATTEAERNTGG